MEALARSGDVNAALQVYREFAQALRSESGGSPDSLTTGLYTRLRSDLSGRTTASPGRSEAKGRVIGRLPHPLTPLVGREDERLDVAANLRHYRLVTLTGPGGIGKTRLAQEVASDVAPDYADGAWLVSLESSLDARLVLHRIAATLDLRERPNEPPLQTLVSHLRSKSALLVLDNCEHLLGACAELCDRLLRECGQLKVLATSREAFGLAGEKVWPVPPLTVPDPTRLPDQTTTLLRVLSGYEAVRLFVERAKSVQKGFDLAPDNAEAVAQVCARLEGVPLAIELAAARTNAMSVEAIAMRSADSLALLSDRGRGATPRQRTLRSTLDWSYDLLNPSEKRVFAQLSVFAGGWSLEAAERICSVPQEAAVIAGPLAALVDKSLVSFEAGTDDGRYRMQEMVRQYAFERLRADGETKETARRHLAWFLEFARIAEPELNGSDQERWLRRVDGDLDNFRAALAFGAESDPESSLRLAGALNRFWYVRGHYAEGRRILRQALAHGGAPSARAKALAGAAILAYSQSDYPTARELASESLEICRELGDEDGTARSLGTLANVACMVGDHPAARELYEKELVIRRGIGDDGRTATVLGNLALVVYPMGEAESAKRLLEESLALRRAANDQFGIANSLFTLAQILNSEGEPEAGRAYQEESLHIYRALGDKNRIAHCLLGLGSCAVMLEDLELVRATQEEAFELLQEIGDSRGMATALLTLGLAEIEAGEISTGRKQVAEGLKLTRQTGDTRLEAYGLQSLGDADCAEGAWESAGKHFRESLRLFETSGDRLGGVPVLQGFAAVLKRSDPHVAIRVLSASCAIQESAGSKQNSFRIRACDDLAAALREIVGQSSFEESWKSGSFLDWEQATAEALSVAPPLSGP